MTDQQKRPHRFRVTPEDEDSDSLEDEENLHIRFNAIRFSDDRRGSIREAFEQTHQTPFNTRESHASIDSEYDLTHEEEVAANIRFNGIRFSSDRRKKLRKSILISQSQRSIDLGEDLTHGDELAADDKLENQKVFKRRDLSSINLGSIQPGERRQSNLRRTLRRFNELFGPDAIEESVSSDNSKIALIEMKRKRKILSMVVLATVLIAVALGLFLLLPQKHSNGDVNDKSKNEQVPSLKVLQLNSNMGGDLGSKDDTNNHKSNFNTNLNKVQVTDSISSEISKKIILNTERKHHFQNSSEENTLKEDYCAKYPNRDIPSNEFPASAWQTDGEYVNNFLDSASQLIQIAKNAIYEEYGYDAPQNNSAFDMFQLHIIDETNNKNKSLRHMLGTGGWATKSSFENLKKRLLHAMFTNDKFTVVLAGGSDALGYGNHFLQSYIMQFHTIMEPLLQKLGVQLITRNLGQKDMGTLHSSLGSKSIYGDEIDILVWDNRYSNQQQQETIDLFYRQALIGGKHAPVIWTSTTELDYSKFLHEKVGADMMGFGTGLAGIPYTTESNVENLPWAVKYLKCTPHNEILCESYENKFRTNCWVERDDVAPPVQQDKHIDAKDDYEGFRSHQLVGRVLSVTILKALDQAVTEWHDATKSGHPLPDKHWHISEHYDNIREKAINLEEGSCFGLDKFLPARICLIPMQARTEYTPRFNPEVSSLTSIVKPNSQGKAPQAMEKMLYDGPDVSNPALEIPEGAINVLSIIRNSKILDTHSRYLLWNFHHKSNRSLSDRSKSEISASKWEIRDSLPGYCDGTSKTICGRLESSTCLLSGYVDSKGGLVGNDSSGLLTTNLENVKYGIVIIMMEAIYPTAKNHDQIKVEDSLSQLPNNFEFEYSLDGIKTIWKKKDLIYHRKIPERFVELYTLLDDEEMYKKEKTQNLELSLRLNNCGENCAVKLTHIYWA